MRVDNDWENGIGKKLFDLEGEVSPDAWKNINQRIKPPQNNRYRWLPALLALLLVPTAVLVTDPFQWLGNEEQALTLENGNQQTILSENSGLKTVGSNPGKPEDAKNAKNKTSRNENPNKITSTSTLTSTTGKSQTSETTSANVLNKPALTKPGNNIQPGLIALSTNTKPVRPVSGSEENKPNQTETTWQNSAANASKQLAKNATVLSEKTEQELTENNSENQNSEQTRKSSATVVTAAKTVGSGAEKPEITFREKVTGNAVKTTENEAAKTYTIAQNGIAGQEKTALEIAALPFKNNLFTNDLSSIDFAETLPDSVKKVLIAGLPEPEFSDEQNKLQKNASQLQNWNFAVYGGPQYAFQRILPNTKDDIGILALKNKNALETERLGFEFGFRASYEVRKNLEVVVGFQATQISQFLRLETTSMKPDSVSIEQSNNAVTMQVFHTTREEEFRFKYYFGGLFTGLNLQVSEKMELSGGLGANWLLSSGTAAEQKSVPTSAFNPYLNLGLQYKHPLTPKVTLTAGPAMQYYLKPVQTDQAFIGMKPTTIGFNVGLKYIP